MTFRKMGIFENLKDLITKGPRGMVNERIKEGLSGADSLANLDRSDLEAMRKYVADQNAQVKSVLGRYGVDYMSAANQSHLEKLQNQAIDKQAAFYQMLQQHQAANNTVGVEPESSIPPDSESQVKEPS